MSMKTYPLVAAGALALLSCSASAYQIVQSHFHVEVAPNKYVDQLVLRCEDGKEITVPWQSKLAESCGEDLMGNVTRPPADAKAAPIDDQQKQAMMTQLRAQYGNISEKQVEFTQGASGTTTHFKGPMVEVLKKYESCRKTHKDKTFCAKERDRAMAQLAEPEAAAAATTESPTPAAPESVSKPARAEPPVAAAATQAAHAEHVAAKPAQPVRAEPVAATPVQAARAEPVATTPVQPAQAEPAAATPAQPARAETVAAAPAQSTTATPAPQPSDAEMRAAAERKVADDYTACMRAKPKFECEQARAKALSALDAPKPTKPQRPRKQAAAAAAAIETQASR
jgi:hypothetical protein